MMLTVVLTAANEPDPTQLASGFAGSFWVMLGLAIAVFALGLNLVRRIRRNTYRAEIREELEQEIAERDAALAAETEASESADGGAEASDDDRV